MSVLALLSQHSELDCEENKHEVGLFDKHSLLHGKTELAKIFFSRVLRGKICIVTVPYCVIIKTYTGFVNIL